MTAKIEVCLGFDGSRSDDWTAIRAETIDGLMFTPAYGPDARPTIWAPEDGRIPATQVQIAVEELMEKFRVRRMYCDPPYWTSEIEAWALRWGDQVVVGWETNRSKPMFEACERFLVDLRSGALRHDGCPITAEHMRNVRKLARSAERYVLSKPVGAYHQKIDAAVTSVVCHEAACDARAAGWKLKTKGMVVF